MRRVFGKHLIRGPDQDVRVLGRAPIVDLAESASCEAPRAGPDHASGPRRAKGSETLGCFRETLRDLLQLTAGQMQLAKNVIDLGLSTNNLEPMLRFTIGVFARFNQAVNFQRLQSSGHRSLR
jgi:hypothetical protein